ncbi:hypothetical protein MACK_001912 [Theileria orientalis]|uniref:Uncharacterized protein n=1 Tax=Theileria orientalis TaxID=68886 RepID=A0A976MB66_THEOR|nr:hypothetical protein MACK_001912 [Theileria orientalis]
MATQLISNDMKENSILLLTLTRFRIDTKPFLDTLSNIEITNNEHIILRSLSESEIKPDDYKDHLKQRINKIYDNYFKGFYNNNCNVEDVVDHIHSEDKVKYMEKYNYICSYCKFISMNLIRNLGHMNLIESYIKSCNTDNVNELDNFTVQQLVDICYNLALVNSETCRIVLDKLDKKNFYKIVHYSELIQMFTKVASFDENNRFGNVEMLILEMYKDEGFKLELEECVNILVAIGRSRKCGVMVIDRVVQDIKNYTNELELNHITKILINLSKVNYNNKGFVRHMANIMLTFIDEDSILDPFTISNTIKSFGRFKYYNETLMKTLLSIMEKEEVLAEFEIHDLVTIFTSLSKIVSSNTVNKININRYFRILANKISKTDLNTETAIKLINASGRIGYNYERFLNTLIESINLYEVDNLSKLCKLKINCDKLSLYYPELTRRIEELERALRPVKDEGPETDEKSEVKSIIEESEIEDYERTICVRRNVMYRDLRLPSVRKRKWTY